MYHLSFRVVVEGQTDEPFFAALLPRALDQICVDVVEPPVLVDVGTWRPHLLPAETRPEAVVRGVRDVFPWVHVVFLHLDGTTDRERELRKYFAPLREEWDRAEPDGRAGRMPLLLPLVPVREMEAWALADLHVLQQLVRRSWADAEVFESARLKDVERLSDPKKTLEDLMSLAPRGRQQRRAVDYLPLLAERISPGALEHVPSFAAWRRDTSAALQQLLTERDKW